MFVQRTGRSEMSGSPIGSGRGLASGGRGMASYSELSSPTQTPISPLPGFNKRDRPKIFVDE